MSQTEELLPRSDTQLEQLKSTLVTASYQYQSQRRSYISPLSQKHREALRELSKNTSVVTAKPDNGSGVVLMDKPDYIAKMNEILSDTSKFQHLDNVKDETDKVERSLTRCLGTMKDQNLISLTLFEHLKPTGTCIPRLYGLPKVHKPGHPLRPILAMCGSPYHQIAQWLVEILEPVRKELSQYSLKDSFQFVDCIKDFDPSDDLLYSLDVCSLFTNVPLVETIDRLCKFVTESNICLPISVNILKDLLLRCTLNVQFLFEGKLYRQIDGVAMGSPLGPLLADIFLSILEKDQLSHTIQKLSLYRRYVDDIFIAQPRSMEVNDVLMAFNSAHPALRFTIETENNNCIPFLDVLLTRTNGNTLSREVYHKPRWSGQYLHFQSAVPIHRKRNLVRNLTERAQKICSSEHLQSALDTIREVKKTNGYPEKFIEKNINFSKKTKVASPTAPKKQLYLSLPFLSDTFSEIVTRRLQNAISSAFNAAELRLMFTTKPMLIQRLKDKMSPSTTSMCIYQFQCSCSAGYIGRTSRHLAKRMREHLPVWWLKGEKRTTKSSILDHLLTSSHQIQPETAFRVIYRVPHHLSKGVKRRLLSAAEAVAIRLFDPILCRQKTLTRALSLPWPDCRHDREHTPGMSHDMSHTH